MKKNILVQVGERTETRIRTHPAQYNEMGEMIADAYDETYTVNVPVLEARNVEMTAEEIAELESIQAQMPAPAPAMEERMTVLETQVSSLMTDEGAEVAMGILDGTIKEEATDKTPTPKEK